MPQPFNAVPHVVVPPTVKCFLLIVLHSAFTTIVNCGVNTFGDNGLPWGSQATS